MTITMNKYFVIVTVMVIVAVAAGFFLVGAQAQSTAPQLMVTWKARTYTPPGFEGKVLPTANSQITASVELFDGGKQVDLSKQVLYWYLNNNFLQGDKGLQNIKLKAPDSAGGTIDLRVEVPNYKQGKELAPQIKTIEIPIVAPKAVIEAPFPNREFSSSQAQLTSLPYFFNVKDASSLNFNWSINGTAPSGAENPQILTIKLNQDAPAGSTLGITLNIQNSNNALEGALANVNVTYKP